MHKENSVQWLCLYIRCKPPFEMLLVDCIFPIIEKLIHDKKIERFFFIRYGEGGPHIRFRINFVNTEALDQNKCGIIQKLIDFIKTNSFNYQQFSQSVLEFKYEPEYKRYGGPHGIIIAEQIFHSSSLHTLKLIKSPEWNYSKALHSALSMNFIMIVELIGHSKEIYDFYLSSFNMWFPYTCYNPEVKALDMTMKENRLKEFNYLFNTAQSWLLPLIGNLVKKKYLYSHDSLWNQEIRIIKSKMIIQQKEMSKTVKKKETLHSIYDGYCHMNNNRLGIRNADESLISFFVLQSLKIIYGKGNASNSQ